jgi:DNA-binding CsgD family transcriptional regulator
LAATYRQSDVSALLRIAGEVAELPCDAQSRRVHILDRLLSLVGGCHAVCSEVDLSSIGSFARAIPGTVVHAGDCSGSELSAVREYLYSGRPLDPCIPHLFRAPGDVVTLRREDVIDRSWYRSEHFNLMRRPSARGESLYAKLRLPDGRHLRMGIQREIGDRPFTNREVQLINVFHENLRQLYTLPRQVGFALNAMPMPDLPPRLQPVLTQLLQGEGEKQIAVKLGLSRHTIHEYVKVIYRQLGVSSRGELLARFVTSDFTAL